MKISFSSSSSNSNSNSNSNSSRSRSSLTNDVDTPVILRPRESTEEGSSVLSCQTQSLLMTPIPTPTQDQGQRYMLDEICSVCLSPFALPCNAMRMALDFDEDVDDNDNDEKDKQSRVVTKCQHVFHEKCLIQVKSRKAECPNCRCALTPILPIVTPDSSPQAIRHSIVSNAYRVRQNMELAARRRQTNSEPSQE